MVLRPDALPLSNLIEMPATMSVACVDLSFVLSGDFGPFRTIEPNN